MFFCDLFDIDMNRNHRNRGGRQGHHNQWPTRHTRNNPLYDDLFDTSRAPSEASSDSLIAIATPGRGESKDAPLPAEIVRRRLSDYVRPVVQRQTTRVNAALQRGANFKTDSQIFGLLPTFHGLPSEDPYRHVDEFSQACEFNQFSQVLSSATATSSSCHCLPRPPLAAPPPPTTAGSTSSGSLSLSLFRRPAPPRPPPPPPHTSASRLLPRSLPPPPPAVTADCASDSRHRGSNSRLAASRQFQLALAERIIWIRLLFNSGAGHRRHRR